MTTGPVVTFNFANWVDRFPVFAAISPGMGQGYFDRACLMFGNDTTNPVFCRMPGQGSGMMTTLLYLLTAHIAWISSPKDATGNPAATGTISQLTGRIKSASEGSVSIDTDAGGDLNESSPSQAWYMQTQWGQEYWAATTQYRVGRYVPNPTQIASFFPARAGFFRLR